MVVDELEHGGGAAAAVVVSLVYVAAAVGGGGGRLRAAGGGGGRAVGGGERRRAAASGGERRRFLWRRAAYVILFYTYVLRSHVFSDHVFLCTFSDTHYRNACCVLKLTVVPFIARPSCIATNQNTATLDFDPAYLADRTDKNPS